MVLPAVGEMGRQAAYNAVEGFFAIHHYPASGQYPAVHTAVTGHLQKAVFVHRGHQHSNLVQMSVQQDVALRFGIAERSYHAAKGIDFYVREKGQHFCGHLCRAVLTACRAGCAAKPEKHFL